MTPEAGVCDQAEAVAKDADKAVEGAEKSAADVKAEVVDQVVAGEAKDTQGKDLSQAVLDANAAEIRCAGGVRFLELPE